MTTRRTARLDLHLPTETREVIERAAHIVGVSITRFVIMHAEIHAEIVVRRTERAEEQAAERRRFCEIARSLSR
jgi:uncharacterized protein (DUF1778 family)